MDQKELAKRIADMPNAEVRKKWQHVASGGFSDDALAEAKDKLARVRERPAVQRLPDYARRDAT